MNTGIQDAWNLAWKLALVVRGTAVEALLDSYEAERWPVGRRLLRYTDRAFGLFTRAISGSPLARRSRRAIGRHILPRLLASRRLREKVFHFVSQLGIRYRESFAVTEGKPRLRRGPKAGDRFPDGPVTRDGRRTHIQQELSGPRFHLVLCGATDQWPGDRLSELTAAHDGLFTVVCLTTSDAPAALVDGGGEMLRRLGVRDAREAAQYLVRPDGHVAFRCAGRDLQALAAYLHRWFGERHGGESCIP